MTQGAAGKQRGGGGGNTQGPSQRTERKARTTRKKKHTRKKERKGRNKPKWGNPSAQGAEETKQAHTTATGKVRRTRTGPGERPAPPGRYEHAHAPTQRTRAWRPPSQKGGCFLPDETAQVHVPWPSSKDGRYRKPHASVTGSTHAKLPQRMQPKTDAGGTRQGQPHREHQIGTTRSEPRAPASAGASGRHNEPGSRPASTCPAQSPTSPGSPSPWGGEGHHSVGKANLSTESNKTGRGAANNAGLRGTPERHAAAHKQGTTTDAKQQRFRGPQTREAHTTRTQPRQGSTCQATANPHTKTHARNSGVQAEREHKHRHPNAPATIGRVQPKP